MVKIGLATLGILVTSRFVSEDFRFAYLLGCLVFLALGLTTHEFFKGVEK